MNALLFSVLGVLIQVSCGGGVSSDPLGEDAHGGSLGGASAQRSGGAGGTAGQLDGIGGAQSGGGGIAATAGIGSGGDSGADADAGSPSGGTAAAHGGSPATGGSLGSGISSGQGGAVATGGGERGGATTAGGGATGVAAAGGADAEAGGTSGGADAGGAESGGADGSGGANARCDVSMPFGPPTSVPGLGPRMARARLSPDEKTVYLSYQVDAGQFHSAIATRPDVRSAFAEPSLLEELVLIGQDDISPSATADGQSLYFESHRGGSWQIYAAQRASMGSTFLIRHCSCLQA
ncbi:MAG: hypothetical protein QM756_37920 [Polyangiaceae bacterium]